MLRAAEVSGPLGDRPAALRELRLPQRVNCSVVEVPLVVPDRDKVCFVGGETADWVGGAPSKSPCLWTSRSRAHGREPRLFAKRLGEFLEPGAIWPLRVATAAG